MMRMAMKVERQLKHRGVAWGFSTSLPKWPGKDEGFEGKRAEVKLTGIEGKKMEMALIRPNIDEDPEATMARFLSDLN